MPFYRRLIPVARSHDVRIVAVTAEEPTVNQVYLASNGVEIDAVASSVKNHVNVYSTPTLLLLRDDGSVIASWRGKLSIRQEDEVLIAVGADKN
jgi:hypothetical protein